jgi:hypothetical protein
LPIAYHLKWAQTSQLAVAWHCGFSSCLLTRLRRHQDLLDALCALRDYRLCTGYVHQPLRRACLFLIVMSSSTQGRFHPQSQRSQSRVSRRARAAGGLSLFLCPSRTRSRSRSRSRYRRAASLIPHRNIQMGRRRHRGNNNVGRESEYDSDFRQSVSRNALKLAKSPV